MNLNADALATLVTVDFEAVNAFVASTVVNADAEVVGINGDSDDIVEVLANHGEINGAATATAIRGSGLVSGSDGGVADSNANATAKFIGIQAKGEADTVDK